MFEKKSPTVPPWLPENVKKTNRFGDSRFSDSKISVTGPLEYNKIIKGNISQLELWNRL